MVGVHAAQQTATTPDLPEWLRNLCGSDESDTERAHDVEPPGASSPQHRSQPVPLPSHNTSKQKHKGRYIDETIPKLNESSTTLSFHRWWGCIIKSFDAPPGQHFTAMPVFSTKNEFFIIPMKYSSNPKEKKDSAVDIEDTQTHLYVASLTDSFQPYSTYYANNPHLAIEIANAAHGPISAFCIGKNKQGVYQFVIHNNRGNVLLLEPEENQQNPQAILLFEGVEPPTISLVTYLSEIKKCLVATSRDGGYFLWLSLENLRNGNPNDNNIHHIPTNFVKKQKKGILVSIPRNVFLIEGAWRKVEYMTIGPDHTIYATISTSSNFIEDDNSDDVKREVLPTTLALYSYTQNKKWQLKFQDWKLERFIVVQSPCPDELIVMGFEKESPQALKQYRLSGIDFTKKHERTIIEQAQSLPVFPEGDQQCFLIRKFKDVFEVTMLGITLSLEGYYYYEPIDLGSNFKCDLNSITSCFHISDVTNPDSREKLGNVWGIIDEQGDLWEFNDCTGECNKKVGDTQLLGGSTFDWHGQPQPIIYNQNKIGYRNGYDQWRSLTAIPNFCTIIGISQGDIYYSQDRLNQPFGRVPARILLQKYNQDYFFDLIMLDRDHKKMWITLINKHTFSHESISLYDAGKVEVKIKGVPEGPLVYIPSTSEFLKLEGKEIDKADTHFATLTQDGIHFYAAKQKDRSIVCNQVSNFAIPQEYKPISLPYFSPDGNSFIIFVKQAGVDKVLQYHAQNGEFHRKEIELKLGFLPRETGNPYGFPVWELESNLWQVIDQKGNSHRLAFAKQEIQQEMKNLNLIGCSTMTIPERNGHQWIIQYSSDSIYCRDSRSGNLDVKPLGSDISIIGFQDGNLLYQQQGKTSHPANIFQIYLGILFPKLLESLRPIVGFNGDVWEIDDRSVPNKVNLVLVEQRNNRSINLREGIVPYVKALRTPEGQEGIAWISINPGQFTSLVIQQYKQGSTGTYIIETTTQPQWVHSFAVTKDFKWLLASVDHALVLYQFQDKNSVFKESDTIPLWSKLGACAKEIIGFRCSSNHLEAIIINEKDDLLDCLWDFLNPTQNRIIPMLEGKQLVGGYACCHDNGDPSLRLLVFNRNTLYTIERSQQQNHYPISKQEMFSNKRIIGITQIHNNDCVVLQDLNFPDQFSKELIDPFQGMFPVINWAACIAVMAIISLTLYDRVRKKDSTSDHDKVTMQEKQDDKKEKRLEDRTQSTLAKHNKASGASSNYLIVMGMVLLLLLLLGLLWHLKQKGSI